MECGYCFDETCESVGGTDPCPYDDDGNLVLPE